LPSQPVRARPGGLRLASAARWPRRRRRASSAGRGRVGSAASQRKELHSRKPHRRYENQDPGPR
jgi:hypothetical protein